MKITTSEHKDILIFNLSGNFDLYAVRELEEEVYSKLNRNLYKRIGFNLADLNSIDSSGLATLMRIGNRLINENYHRALYNVPGNILEIIIHAGLNEFYLILSEKQFLEKFVNANPVQNFFQAIKSKTIQKLRGKSLKARHWIKFGLAILFFLSIVAIEYITYSQETKRLEEMANFFQGYLWEMDDANARDFAKLLLETKNYYSIKILHPDDKEFISTSRTGLEGVNNLLYKIHLIRLVNLEHPISKQAKKIGKISIEWININFYYHVLNFLAFFLLYGFVKYYLRVIESKEALNQKNLEITEKMEEVQKLKTQQDGDYFLTSLLTKPLCSIAAQSNKFKIESFIRQKKRFEFKKKTHEIGGDISITDTIYLRGRRYIVFVNADAMGKSLQGAGGVLVFGSAFNSILTRNKSSQTMQNFFPEVWIKNTIVDLHKVFESFECSMLISCILGLIDEESGFLYWMNAEHPSLVLYRDEKAELLDKEHILLKLGTLGVNNKFIVKTLQLREGDIIFAGSDGKDDIIIGQDEFGQNIINSDENKFLSFVEKAKGDLQKIYSLIKETGEIADDISILKIEHLSIPKDVEFFGLESLITQAKRFFTQKKYEEVITLCLEILEKYPKNPDALKLLIRIYYERKDFIKITEYIDDYVAQRPLDTEFLFLASYCHKKAKNFTLGIAYGERYRLRNPNSIRNLMNLYDLYFKSKNYEKSIPLLDQILELDPLNQKALAWKGGKYEDFEI